MGECTNAPLYAFLLINVEQHLQEISPQGISVVRTSAVLAEVCIIENVSRGRLVQGKIVRIEQDFCSNQLNPLGLDESFSGFLSQPCCRKLQNTKTKISKTHYTNYHRRFLLYRIFL